MTHRGRKSRFDSIQPSVLRPLVVPASTRHPPPPKHLVDTVEAQIWEHVIRDFQLPAIGIDILRTSLEAHMRARECREAISRDGMVITNSAGQQKPHPLLAVERDSRAAWLQGIKQLNLDLASDASSYPSPWTDAAS
jgi:hypothetical protein